MVFPDNPARGQRFTHDDTVYEFNGASWYRKSVGSNNSTDYSGGSFVTQDDFDAVLIRLQELELNALLLE